MFDIHASPALYRILISLHLVGASVWIGGHLVLATTLLPRALRNRDPSIILDFEKGFERIGLPSLLLQVVTGLLLAYRWLPEIGAWFSLDSNASIYVAAKLSLLTATLGLALNARWKNENHHQNNPPCILGSRIFVILRQFRAHIPDRPNKGYSGCYIYTYRTTTSYFSCHKT